MSEKTIFRVVKNPENPYVMINKSVLQDKRLSWRAKGLLCFMLSMPDNWEFHREHLMEFATDGKHTLRVTLKELEEFGYTKLSAERGKDGRITKWITAVYESPRSLAPQEVYPDVDLPHVAKQHVVNQPLSNNNINTNNDFNNINNIVHFQKKCTEVDGNGLATRDELQKIFDRLWDYYPVKKGKQTAYKAFLRHMAGKTLAQAENVAKEIWQGLVGMLQEYRWKQEFKEHECPNFFISSHPHGSTFFNQARWLDEYETDGDKFIAKLRMENLKRRPF